MCGWWTGGWWMDDWLAGCGSHLITRKINPLFQTDNAHQWANQPAKAVAKEQEHEYQATQHQPQQGQERATQ